MQTENISNLPFARAIRKYGICSFKFEVMLEEYGSEAQQKCKDAEMLAIELFESQVPHGYNATAGGDGAIGFKHTEGFKAAQAARTSERNKLPEVQAFLKERNSRPEVKAAKAAILVERNKDPEFKARLKVANSDHKVRAKRSASARAASSRPEVKEKQSAAQKIAQNRPEVKAKSNISDLHKKAKKLTLCVETGVVFGSLTDARQWVVTNGFPNAGLSRLSECANGKVKSAYGYTWKFIEKEMA